MHQLPDLSQLDHAQTVELIVASGATSVKEPITKPWGQKVGYVLDNNGVLVELATPLGQ